MNDMETYRKFDMEIIHLTLAINNICEFTAGKIHPNSCIHLLVIKSVCYMTTIHVKLVNLMYQHGNVFALLNLGE